MDMNSGGGMSGGAGPAGDPNNGGGMNTPDTLMAPPGSVHARQHVGNWLQRAAMDLQRPQRSNESLHRSWVFGISPADYRTLRALLTDAIRSAQQIIPRSERSELACMSLSLFQV